MTKTITKADRQILALTRAARNPKYRPGIKRKIGVIKNRQAWANFLAK